MGSQPHAQLLRSPPRVTRCLGPHSTVIREVQTPSPPRNPTYTADCNLGSPSLPPQHCSRWTSCTPSVCLLTLLWDLSQTHTWSGSHWPAGAAYILAQEIAWDKDTAHSLRCQHRPLESRVLHIHQDSTKLTNQVLETSQAWVG